MSAYDIMTWRANNAYAGENILVWSPLITPLLDPTPGNWTLPSGITLYNPTRYSDQPYLQNWIYGIAIDGGVSPGDHVLSWAGGAHTVTVTTVAPPATTPTTRIAIGATAADINTAMETYKTLYFEPGTYYLERDLVAPDGVTIYLDGEGHTSFVRNVLGSEYHNRMISLEGTAGTINVKGIRFVNLEYDFYVYHGTPTGVRRVDVLDCVFEQCELSLIAPPAGSSFLVRRCVFRKGAGTGPSCGGFFYDNNEFQGGTYAGQFAFWAQAATGVVGLSNDFSYTNRGLILRLNTFGCFYCGNRFYHVSGGQENGGEVILLECVGGNEMSQNAFIWNHAEGCTGPGISLSGANIHDNLFLGRRLLCLGQSFYLAQVDNAAPAITANVFADFETDGLIQVTATKVNGNTFSGIFMRQNSLSSGNQPPALDLYDATSGFPIQDLSTSGGNTYMDCYITQPMGLVKITQIDSTTFRVAKA